MNELQRLYEIEKAAKLLRFSAERDNWPIRDHGRFRSLCAALDGLVYDEDSTPETREGNILPCGCDTTRTAKWIRRECGCLPPDRDAHGDPTDI